MNAVELKNVIKTYGDYRLSIENLSLPVGYIMGLVGENGAGKSTVMKLILRMITMRPVHWNRKSVPLY